MLSFCSSISYKKNSLNNNNPDGFSFIKQVFPFLLFYSILISQFSANLTPNYEIQSCHAFNEYKLYYYYVLHRERGFSWFSDWSRVPPRTNERSAIGSSSEENVSSSSSSIHACEKRKGRKWLAKPVCAIFVSTTTCRTSYTWWWFTSTSYQYIFTRRNHNHNIAQARFDDRIETLFFNFACNLHLHSSPIKEILLLWSCNKSCSLTLGMHAQTELVEG